MKVYKALHFDMDGVIANTEPYHVAAEIATCKDFGFPVNQSDWLGFKGRTAADIFGHLIDKYGDPKVHKPQELIARKTDRFIELAERELKPIDGALDFIEWARNEYSKIALVTSSNRRIQQFIVNAFCIADCFDQITTGDDIIKGKPDPEPYERSLRCLQVEAEESLVIEDSASGIKSAQAARCDVLAIATSHTAGELLSIVPPPNFVVDSFRVAVDKIRGH
jgi:HAD superfamily hydrolase (TIGR01509 family)